MQPSGTDAAMNRVTLAFRSPETERRYRRWHYETHHRYMRIGILTSAVVMTLVGVVELLSFPAEVWRFALAVRFGAVLPLIGLLYAFTVVPALQPITRRFRQEITLVVVPLIFVALGVIGERTVSATGLVPDGYAAMGFVIAQLFMYLVVRLRFTYAMAVCVPLNVLVLPLLLDSRLDPMTSGAALLFTGVSNFAGAVGCYLVERSSRRLFCDEARRLAAQREVERLLARTLPAEVVPSLAQAGAGLARRHDEVTVIFAKVVGLSAPTARLSAARLVQVLDELVSSFDTAAAALGVAKVKTIGASWMGVAGALREDPQHAAHAAWLSRHLRGAVAEVAERHGLALELRVGLHSGPVVGGVIGAQKLAWDIWGATVNLAARMASTSAPGQVQLTAATRARLGEGFACRARGEVAIKGVGDTETWWLGEPRDPEPPRPADAPAASGGDDERGTGGTSLLESGLIHPVSLRFIDRDTERSYWRDYLGRQDGLLRVMGIAAVLATLPVDPLEARFFPEVLGELRFWRFGVMMPACLLGVLAITLPRPRRWIAEGRLQPIFAALVMVSLVALAQASVLILGQARAAEHLAVYLGLGYMATITVLYVVLRLQVVYAVTMGAASLVIGVGTVVLASDVPLGATVMSAQLCAIGWAAGAMAAYSIELIDRRRYLLHGEIEAARSRAEALLESTLPPSVAARIAAGETTLAEAHADVSVVFADLVGFTDHAQRVAPEVLVADLDRLFREFDERCSAIGAEKVKTMGDAWMAVVGAPEPRPDHAEVAVRLALSLQEALAETRLPLRLRAGVHRGPVIAGVIGRDRVQFDVWGETVELAEGLESSGAPGQVQVSEAVAADLPADLQTQVRGLVEVGSRRALRALFVSSPSL